MAEVHKTVTLSKNIFITLLHIYVQCVYSVYAKYQIVSPKAAVEVDFSRICTVYAQVIQNGLISSHSAKTKCVALQFLMQMRNISVMCMQRIRQLH